jgi:2-polyprenyl-6-methoxyphenol hydroxylase-like FAD-dependent oxidoreductase
LPLARPTAAAPRTALIVGAGIGGLAAGLALRRAGWQVQIHEQAAHPRELGFALALAPNAMSALDDLGLADTITAEGVPTTKAEVRHADGRLIRAFNAQLGGSIVVALRQALHGVLMQAVGRDAVVPDSEVIDVAVTGDGASLVLKGGRTVQGDVLVGADGVGSIVRRRLHPHEPPARPSGFCALRGVAYGAGHYLGDLAAVGYLGDGVEAATARASSEAVYWYLSLLAADVSGDGKTPQTLVEEHAAGFDGRFRAIAAATRSDDMRFDVLLERQALEHWGTGRITLVGDAAHPMLPHTGQGAAQALEDAVALGLVLGPHGNVESALRRYEHVRSRRTRRFIKLGPRLARITTTRSSFVKLLRTTAVRWLPESVLVSTPSRWRDPHRVLRSLA